MEEYDEIENGNGNGNGSGNGYGDSKSNNKRGQRAISRRACDACRLRKIRCEPCEEPPSISHLTHLQHSQDGSRKRPRDADSSPCKACAAVPLECTFEMPVKRRGPPNRLAQQQAKMLTQDHQPPAIQESGDINGPNFGPSPQHTASHSGSTGHGGGKSISIPEMDTTLQLSNGSASHLSTYGVPTADHVIKPETLMSFISTNHSTSFEGGIFDTGLICSKDLFDIIMADYINILHPITPVVHVPTFRDDLDRQRQTFDPVFLALTLALCAFVVGALPRKFHEYHLIDQTFRFKNRRGMITYCHKLIELSKPDDFYDYPTHEKWAITFISGLSFIHSNMSRRYMAQHGESTMMLEQLNIHRISGYRGLDCIEAQLRKKAFWLNFYCWTHRRIEDQTWPSLTDRLYYENSDADQLWPLEVDDEYITRTEVFGQPPFKPSLVTAFNAASRIFVCLLPIVKDPVLPVMTASAPHEHLDTPLGRCSCGNIVHAVPTKDVIVSLLSKVRYILDDLPAEFGPWHSDSIEGPEARDDIGYMQSEAMRANIHATHLWAQSVLTERLIVLSHPSTVNDEDAKYIWSSREDICRQLLQVLYNIRQSNLEPNGMALTYKIREVASTLLDCPFEQQSHVARRATSYISKFVDILARVDGNMEPAMETQLWSTFDQQPRAFPSDFAT